MLRTSWWGAGLLALLLSCVAASASARPFTVDDMLHQESLGALEIDPTGRWLVVEHRGPYDRAGRYDYASENSLAFGRLEVVDLRRPRPARALLADNAGPGVVIGAFSPGGTRLAVYRLHDRRWSLGVVTMATRAVRWFDITPQEVGRGRALQWVSEDSLILIARTDGLPPTWMRLGWLWAARLPPRWAAAARGEAAVSVLGSGAYADVRRRAAPNRLLQLTVTNGAARELARDSFFDLELSPDRRRVALLASGPDIQAQGDGPVRGPAGVETEATRLSMLDLATGQRVVPCPRCDVLPQLLTWSPSGRSLLVLDRGANGLWTTGRLLRVLAGEGSVVEVGVGLTLRIRLNPVTVWTDWIGEDPIVLGRRPGDPRDDWFRLAEGGLVNLTQALPAPDDLVRLGRGEGLAVLAGGELWSVDAEGGASRRLATGVRLAQRGPRSVAGVRLDRGPQSRWWLQTSRVAVARLDTSGLADTAIAPPAGGVLEAAAGNAPVAAYRVLDDHGVERLWVARPGVRPVRVLTLNAGLADTDTPQVFQIRHVDASGRRLTSWLFVPKVRPTTGAPPLVVRPYLGSAYDTAPRDPTGQLGFTLNLRVLTGHGYAVLVPSLPRPGGRLEDPAKGLADTILGIVQSARNDPEAGAWVDADNMAIVGFSFGGYTVMSTLTQTHRFRAAVAMSGISDLTAYWAEVGAAARLHPEAGYMTNWHTGAVEATQPTLGRPPWADPDRYVRNSPLYAANRIETPLLLIHGAQDALPVYQSEAMYSALFRQGKDALLVTYWAGQHGLMIPGDVRDAYARTFGFLDRHLAPPVVAYARRSP